MQLCFVSVHGPRETYFVDEPRIKHVPVPHRSCSSHHQFYLCWGMNIQNNDVTQGQVRVRVTLRLTVSQSVCLGVEPNLGQLTRVSFLLEISYRQLQVCNFVAPSLTRGRVCKLLYNCSWALPEQSLLGRSPAELTGLFYCLI
jgi:hypothetical protein